MHKTTTTKINLKRFIFNDHESKLKPSYRAIKYHFWHLPVQIFIFYCYFNYHLLFCLWYTHCWTECYLNKNIVYQQIYIFKGIKCMKSRFFFFVYIFLFYSYVCYVALVCSLYIKGLYNKIVYIVNVMWTSPCILGECILASFGLVSECFI